MGVSLGSGISKSGTAFVVGEALGPLLPGRMSSHSHWLLGKLWNAGAFFAPLPRRASLYWTGESGKLGQWVNREASWGQEGKTQRNE